MKKRTNPLTRRIPRELAGDWRKYLVVFLFLVLTIGFVSGMYVANESMMRASVDGVTTYKLEYGHFELSRAADDTLLAAIETGGKADVRQFYTDKARRELGEKFPGEFRSQFDSEFRTKFDAEFQNQVKQTLLAGGLDALQALITIAALPFAVLMALVMVSVYRELDGEDTRLRRRALRRRRIVELWMAREREAQREDREGGNLNPDQLP